MKKSILAVLATSVFMPVMAADWQETLDAARGQTVYWNAWGGDQRTNDFIAWASEQTEEQFGVTIEQVKLTDTAEAVNRVLSEKTAGKDEGGSVDMIWINGPNFLAMKEQGLLHGPFVADLPNAQYLDLSEGSAANLDFTTPVEGMESPWRLARFVFAYDTARVDAPPANMADFANWAAANPGRVTHPIASDFMGATFLKQALVELAPDASVLQAEVTEENFAAATGEFWSWYEELRPNLWRAGEAFPENQSVQQQMMNDGEIDITLSFDPAFAAAAINEGTLPDTTRIFVSEAGSIGNISFVAIPYNAANKEGAEVVANFLLDPATQAHMQNIEVLGSYAVLNTSTLSDEQRGVFDALPSAPALPSLDDLGTTLAEPHASWMTKLTEEWTARYAQ